MNLKEKLDVVFDGGLLLDSKLTSNDLLLEWEGVKDPNLSTLVSWCVANASKSAPPDIANSIDSRAVTSIVLAKAKKTMGSDKLFSYIKINPKTKEGEDKRPTYTDKLIKYARTNIRRGIEKLFQQGYNHSERDTADESRFSKSGVEELADLANLLSDNIDQAVLDLKSDLLVRLKAHQARKAKATEANETAETEFMNRPRPNKRRRRGGGGRKRRR